MASPEKHMLDMINCRDKDKLLNDWELKFIEEMNGYHHMQLKNLSARDKRILESIYMKLF